MMDPTESRKLVKSFSNRVMRRLIAAGAPMHIREDVEQELWIAWCKARDTYDETRQVLFSTYLYGGMKQHINRWAEKNVARRHAEVIALSLDAPAGEDENGSLMDVLPSADPAPDAQIEAQSYWEYATRRLKPRAKLFITLLRDPPAELLEQAKQLEAKASYARSNGKHLVMSGGVTTSLIFDLMGAGKNERIRISDQIKKAGEKSAQRLQKQG